VTKKKTEKAVEEKAEKKPEPKMKKPKPTRRESLDFNESTQYLEEAHNIKTRDFAGKFAGDKENYQDIPYLDFWHWLLKRHDVHNGCYMTLSQEEFDEIEPGENNDWVRTIYGLYLEEFADDTGEAEFWVSW
jgi:hypothetical protein